MRARTVVALSEPGLSEGVAAIMDLQGHHVSPLSDSMTALDALDDGGGIGLLVASAEFGPGKLNGVALARMARMKCPGVKVLLVGEPELQRHIDSETRFVPLPITPSELATIAADLLNGAGQEQR